MTGRNATRFSLTGLAVAAVTVGVGTAAGLEFVPVVGSYVGMLLGGFVAGLAVEERPVLETGLAAVLAELGLLAAGPLVGTGIATALAAVGSISPTTLLVSVVLSFAVGAFGAHFGDDLRDGLTAPVEESTPRPTLFESLGSALTATESTEVERADDPADRRPADAEIDHRPDDSGIDRPLADSGVDPRSESTESTDVELEREE